MGESVGIDPADGRVIALCRLLHDATLGQADADTVLAGIDQLHPAGTAGPVAAAEAVLFAFLRLRCPDARPAVQEDPAGSPEEEAGDGWACLREAAEATDGSGSLKAQSRMLTGISEALASSGHVLPALNALSSAAALLEAIGDVEGSAAVHSRLGEALLAAGSASQAQQEFARAVLVFGETGTPVDAGFLFRNVMNWGRCLSIQGDHANAEQEYRLAVHVSSQASGPATDPAEAHLLLADSLRQQDRPGEAVPEYEAALGLLRQGPERAGDRMATALMGLAACHQSTGDTAMLIGSLAEALEYLDQADTARHAAVNFTLARAHSETGSTALAAAHYREAALRYTELTDAVRAALSWWQAAAALRDLDLLREALDARLAAWEALAGSGQAPDPALVQDVALGAAHSLISAGRPAEAEAPARAAIDAARATAATVAEADAHLRLGQALQAQERFPEALDCYERARRLCPTGSLALEAQDRLGMCLLALNMFHEAGQAFARAAVEAKEAGEPGTADGLHFKAGLALVHAAPGEAEQHLRAVLVSTSAQGNPARTAAVLSALAEALVQLNRHREAEETYRCAGSTYEQIGEDEESAESLNRAADTARAHGRHEDALASYQEVIARGSEAGPKNVADSYTGSGISLYKLGRYGEAEASFRHAHALYTEDDNPGAAALCLEWIADTYAARDRHAEAEEHRRAAVEAYEGLGRPVDAARMLDLVADSIRSQGRHEDAVDAYRKVLDREEDATAGTVASSHWGSGISLYKLGRHEEAEASFRQAHALYTEDDNPGAAALCLEWIADTYAARDRHAEAEECFRAAAQAYEGLGRPGDAVRMLERVGDSIRFQGRHEDAVHAYRQVLDREEEAHAGAVASACFRAGVSLHALGRYEEAEASFRQAHALYTEDDNPGAAALCLEWIADTYAARDRHAEAEEHRRAAVEAYEGLGRPVDAARMLDLVADSIRSQGRHEDAVDAYRKVLDREEDATAGTVASSHWGSGISLYKLGRHEEAEASFRQAHALYTEDDNPGAAALCLEWIADTYAARDRHADAEEHRRAAVEAYEGLDRPVDAARMLDLVADSIRFQGRHEDALDAYRKVVDWEEEVAAGTIARAYHGRALALGRLGRLSDSSLDYRRAWWAYRALGDSTAAARSMLGIARNHRNEQSPHRAVHACRAVIRLLRSRPDPDGLCGDAHQLLGQIFASSGETVWAVEEYGKAIFEHTRARCLGDVIRDQMLLAIVSLDDGLNKAKILHLGAQAKAVAASDRKSMLTAAGIFAHALASNGDPAGAQRVLESAGVGRDEADEEDIPELRLAKGALAVVRDFSADGSGRSSGSGRPGSPLARASLALMGQDWEAVISIHREVNSDPTARCSQGTAAFGAFLRICAAAYIARDRWLEAESCLDECLNVVHRLPEGPARWNLNSGAEALLGQVRLETGRAEEAYEHFRAAHASAQKSPVPAVRVQGQVMLGQAIAHPGASEKMLRLAARVLYGAATEAFDSGLSAQAIGGDCLRAIVHAKLGDNEFALKILDYDIGYARRHGMPQSLSSLLTTKAVLLEASGAAEASADVLREAAEAAEAEGLFEALGDSLRDLARVTAGLGRDLGEVQSIADSAADAYWRAGLPQEIARLRLDIVDELWEKSDDRGRARTRSEFLATALPAMRYLDSIRYDFLSASERASWQRQYLWGRSLTFEMAASGGGSDTVSDLIETQINASVFGSAGQQGAKTLGAPPAVHDPHGQGPIEAKPTAGLMAGFQLAATASGTGVHLVSSALPVSPPPNLLIPSAGGCRVALARFPAGEDLTIPADEASVRTW